jgi:hypothetical protein
MHFSCLFWLFLHPLSAFFTEGPAVTKNKHLARKTNRVVRMPAVRFPKLRKQMLERILRDKPK